MENNDSNYRENNGSNSIVKAGLILALAIAGLFGYLYFVEKQEGQERIKEIEAKSEEISLTKSKLDSLTNELNLRISELSTLGAKVEDLEKAKLSLESDRNRLLSAKSLNLNEYSAKIKQYELFLAKKDMELENLRRENGNLTDKNTQLKQSNTSLKETKAKLETEFRDSVVKFTKTKKELEDKVAIGAALRPFGYLVTAINKRGKERDGDSFKSRRVDRIMISFKLAENPLTKKEIKTIYMRLINPVGNVISDKNLDSGGSFNFGGKELVYTTKQTVNYTNSNQNVEVYYNREQKYEKGQYKIELYAEGFRIGVTEFWIK